MCVYMFRVKEGPSAWTAWIGNGDEGCACIECSACWEGWRWSRVDWVRG